MTKVVKVINKGAYQEIRLPKEFHFEEDEVCIERVGKWGIMLFPKAKAWEIWKERLSRMDEDFMADRNQPKRAEKRKPLDK